MKPTLLGCLVAATAVMSNAAAQERTPVQDARPLLIAAIEAADGQSRGVLVDRKSVV